MTRMNMSTADRWIRVGIVAVIALLLKTGTLSGWSAVMFSLLGFGWLVSSLTGFCPAYLPFHVNTERRTRKPV